VSPTSPRDPSTRPPPLIVRFGRWIATLDLTSAEHHVALTMALYANGDGRGIRPGVATIARDTGLSESAVIRAIHGRTGADGERRGGLLRRGVFVQVDPGGGRRRPAEYRINPVPTTEYPTVNTGPRPPYPGQTLSSASPNPSPATRQTLSHGDPKRVEEEEEEGTRAGAPEAPRAGADDDALAENYMLATDPAVPPKVREVARKQYLRLGGIPYGLEREEATG
jgi:hypothetical protein